MYDIYAQKSNYPFKGKVFKQYRYFQEDTVKVINGITYNYIKGAENPFFKLSWDEFMFNITSTKSVDKKQPINNLVFKVTQLMIDTKFENTNFVQGGYIEYDGKLWIVKKSEKETGPQKSIYAYFNYNPLSTTKMLLEEVYE